jgi:hypothetical protein
VSFFGPDQIEAFSKSTVRVGLLYELFFKSETARYWSGNTSLIAGGRQWLPTFGMVQVSGLGATSEAVSRQVTLSVSGVDEKALRMVTAETEEADQQPAVVHLQLFDDEWQNAGATISIFPGIMQPPKVSRSAVTQDKGAEQTISISLENAFLERARPAYGRYTASDQNHRTEQPDDFCNFIPSLFSKTFTYPDY